MKKKKMLLCLLLCCFVREAFCQPLRVLPMAPNLVETVFALGAGDRVAGIPEYTVFPPEALALPSVGGYFNPNLERITALRPDLVVVQGRHEKLQTYCRKMGFPVLSLAMEDRASIADGILTLGEKLERKQEALALVSAMDRELAILSRRFHRERPVKVLLVLGRTPGTLSQIMTAGRETYLTELVALAGGENVFSDQKQRYPTVSKETILIRQPEVILEILPGGEVPEKALLRLQWQALGAVPAVRDGRVLALGDARLLMPGPRIAEAAALLGEALEEVLAWTD